MYEKWWWRGTSLMNIIILALSCQGFLVSRGGRSEIRILCHHLPTAGLCQKTLNLDLVIPPGGIRCRSSQQSVFGSTNASDWATGAGLSLMNISSQVFHKSSQKVCNILSAWEIYRSEGHVIVFMVNVSKGAQSPQHPVAWLPQDSAQSEKEQLRRYSLSALFPCMEARIPTQ